MTLYLPDPIVSVLDAEAAASNTTRGRVIRGLVEWALAQAGALPAAPPPPRRAPRVERTPRQSPIVLVRALLRQRAPDALDLATVRAALNLSRPLAADALEVLVAAGEARRLLVDGRAVWHYVGPAEEKNDMP